jgi:undecaprenyl-diphosphatase
MPYRTERHARSSLQALAPSAPEPVRLSRAQAIALGALHGPAELLPISSSAHVTLLPWLLGWDYSRLDGELRKTFEVALHAGTAVALLIAMREEEAQVLHRPRLAGLVVLSSVPGALAGYALEGPIERRLGTARTIAAALAGGSLAMAWADRTPQERTEVDAGVLDAVYLGFSQALALVPGISRSGATRAALRLRLFTRRDSSQLSRLVALPVIGGAALLRGLGVSRRGLPDELRGPFALGAAASFASTIGSLRLIRRLERDGSLAPFVVYRLGLSAIVLSRLSAKRR